MKSDTPAFKTLPVAAVGGGEEGGGGLTEEQRVTA